MKKKKHVTGEGQMVETPEAEENLHFELEKLLFWHSHLSFSLCLFIYFIFQVNSKSAFTRTRVGLTSLEVYPMFAEKVACATLSSYLHILSYI